MDSPAQHSPITPGAAWPGSESYQLRDLVHLLDGDADALGPMAQLPVAVRRLTDTSSLVHEGAPLESLYVVRCGSLKCVRSLEDGYEQVTALALPGEVLGFEGLHSGQHATSVVALEYATVCVLPLASLQALRETCPAFDEAWQRALSRQMARLAATVDMLSAVASDVRLARFILWLSARAEELGWSPRRLRLSLCRRDLASLLGVAHETVSRSFTLMSDAGLLKVDRRDVEILELAQLQARALSTRRPTDAAPVATPHAAGRAVRQRQHTDARWPSPLPEFSAT